MILSLSHPVQARVFLGHLIHFGASFDKRNVRVHVYYDSEFTRRKDSKGNVLTFHVGNPAQHF